MADKHPALPDLPRLTRFLRVAELGSLTRAAEALDATQSVLSLQMSALERDFGGRLFHRTGRGVTLTDLGERLLPRVRALLLDAQQLAADARSSSGVPVGEVTLGLLPSVSMALVGSLLRKQLALYPGIRLRIVEGSNGQLDDWLTQGRVDAAVMFRYVRSGARYATPLATVQSYLIGPPDDPLTCAETVMFERLDGVPLVLAGAPNGLRMTLDQAARRRKITLSVVLEADSIQIQRAIVAEGQAHTILAWRAVAREVKSGELQASRIVNPVIDRSLELVTTRRRPLSHAAREIGALVRRTVEDLGRAGAWRRS